MRPSWHEYFMLIAKVVATRSTCNSRPIGAVIVKDNRILATGYNGAIPKATHCTSLLMGKEPFCMRRYMKAEEHSKMDYCVAVHAEANAVAQAAKMGISIDGASIYCTVSPCYSCFKLLASAGIKEIYYEYLYESKDKKRDKYWEEQIKKSGIHISQVIITDRSLKYMLDMISGITSKRRID